MTFQQPLRSATHRLHAVLPRNRPENAPTPGRLVRLALASVAAFAVAFLPLELKVSGEFKVLPTRNADARAAVDGLIEEVLAREGQRVHAGDVLARLSDRDHRSELEQTMAEMAEKQASLKMLQAGARPEEIALARTSMRTAAAKQEHAQKRFAEGGRIRATRIAKATATVKAAEEQLQFLRGDVGRFQQLFVQGLVAQKQVDEARHNVAVQENELDAANAELASINADDWLRSSRSWPSRRRKSTKRSAG